MSQSFFGGLRLRKPETERPDLVLYVCCIYAASVSSGSTIILAARRTSALIVKYQSAEDQIRDTEGTTEVLGPNIMSQCWDHNPSAEPESLHAIDHLIEANRKCTVDCTIVSIIVTGS